MKSILNCALLILLIATTFSCKKTTEDFLVEGTWNFQSDYEYNDGISANAYSETGTFNFKKDGSGSHFVTNSSKTYSFDWIVGENSITIQYQPSTYENNQIQEYMSGGYIVYEIIKSEENTQEWKGNATYRINSEKTFPCTISLKLSK